jgi:hypothetical protein
MDSEHVELWNVMPTINKKYEAQRIALNNQLSNALTEQEKEKNQQELESLEATIRQEKAEKRKEYLEHIRKDRDEAMKQRSEILSRISQLNDMLKTAGANSLLDSEIKKEKRILNIITHDANFKQLHVIMNDMALTESKDDNANNKSNTAVNIMKGIRVSSMNYINTHRNFCEAILNMLAVFQKLTDFPDVVHEACILEAKINEKHLPGAGEAIP